MRTGTTGVDRTGETPSGLSRGVCRNQSPEPLPAKTGLVRSQCPWHSAKHLEHCLLRLRPSLWVCRWHPGHPCRPRTGLLPHWEHRLRPDRSLLSGALNVGSRTMLRPHSHSPQCNRLPCPTMDRAKSSASCRSYTSRTVALFPRWSMSVNRWGHRRRLNSLPSNSRSISRRPSLKLRLNHSLSTRHRLRLSNRFMLSPSLRPRRSLRLHPLRRRRGCSVSCSAKKTTADRLSRRSSLPTLHPRTQLWLRLRHWSSSRCRPSHWLSLRQDDRTTGSCLKMSQISWSRFLRSPLKRSRPPLWFRLRNRFHSSIQFSHWLPISRTRGTMASKLHCSSMPRRRHLLPGAGFRLSTSVRRFRTRITIRSNLGLQLL